MAGSYGSNGTEQLRRVTKPRSRRSKPIRDVIWDITVSSAVAALAMLPLVAFAQSTCPPVNFLTQRTANLKPTATSHIDVIRQPDGSYTGFEAADSSPYRVIAATPHFERQFATCLPHTIPVTPSAPAPNANPRGAGAQFQATAMLASGNYFKATLGNQGGAVIFDLFDSQDNLLSESSFSYYVNVGPGNRADVFRALALADMNGDGKLDLVAVFDTNRINGAGDRGRGLDFPSAQRQ